MTRAALLVAVFVAGCGLDRRGHGGRDTDTEAGVDAGTDTLSVDGNDAGRGADVTTEADSGEDATAAADASKGEDVCVENPRRGGCDDCPPGHCGGGCGGCSSGWTCMDGRCVEDPPPPGRCRESRRCDCPQGQECNTAGAYVDHSYPCIATDPPRYCCDKPGCPDGQVCQTEDGRDGPGDGTRWSCGDVIFCPGDPRC